MTSKTGLRAVHLLLILSLLVGTLLSGCTGEDFTPVYFPPPDGEADEGPDASTSDASRQCTLSFTSQICVQIKGDNIEVGIEAGDELCAEVGSFPIHVTGNQATLNGNEFPDIEFEGHGLPAPITINGRGDGDGSGNAGQGAIDSSGNISIDGFSFFIVALGIVGEIPNLTLTTGTTEELDFLPPISGSPPDASGAMTLVTGTALGHIIDAADEYLLGASLTATFRGQVTPPLSQCGGDDSATIEVKKVVISPDGQQTESAIPEERIMEVSNGTFIAETSADIGPNYESTAKFKVRNTGGKAVTLAIPPRKGPFYLSSATTPLTGSLSPQQSFILNATFKPKQADGVVAGTVIENISIGPDQFQLTGVALDKSGSGSVSIVGEDGSVTAPDVDDVEVGDAEVQANTERRFFLCEEIECNGAKSFTSCTECTDPTTMPCELLTVSTEGKPLGEVDSQCNPIDPNAAPLYTIDLKGSADISVSAHKQVLALRNKGVESMTIESISLDEVEGSQSQGQFKLPDDALFVAQSIDEVQEQISKTLAGENADGAKLPVTLPPFQTGYDETTAFIVITYTPDDLLGSDGQQAGVGSKVEDKALLMIVTDHGEIVAEVSGTTTISETPALELYIKTSTGTKRIEDGTSFPFQGVTTDTVDIAVPVFLRVADTAGHSLRITSIATSGEDELHFLWLDTKEEIEAVKPESGKGMRCSIPIVDENTGSMIDELFDLDPVHITASGYDMAPGAYSLATMPLFGCIDFHRDEGSALEKKLYVGELTVEAVELSASGLPAQNPDGSPKTTTLNAQLLAAIDPLSGHFVLRITQTSATILNQDFPALSAVSSKKDMQSALDSGMAKETDLQLFTGAMVLDPFDEMTIESDDGTKTLSTPNDGITAIFRRIDTHPVSTKYGVEGLFDHASLLHDDLLDTGLKGIYEDFPNIPEGTRANSWRIYTTSLSYPGPMAPQDQVPHNVSDCIVVNPCDPEGLKMFTEAGVQGGKGACAFFYATGGRYDSPAFHTAEEMEGGEYAPLCENIDKPQNLLDMDMGKFTVDGHLVMEEAGLRFFGPTYFHNPGGPLGPMPPMDMVFHMAFTTGTLKPQEDENDPDVLPDTKIDLSAGEFLMNLTDNTAKNPQICESNTDNRIIDGKTYSTWRYLDGLIFKDAEGTQPAGCPEDDNEFNGGVAYLRGKPLDPATGNITLVAGAKFGSSDDLSFAFKDVMMFLVLKGWMCDPNGSEEDMEGSHCYDIIFNDRDAASQQSITDY